MVNLYFPGAVSKVEDFYDREIPTERVSRAFLVNEERVVIVKGERRSGKTSFLRVTNHRLATSSSHRFEPFFFSEQWVISSFKDFAREVLQRFCKFTGKTLGDTGLLDEGGHFQEPSRQQSTDALAILLRNVSDHVFVIT